MKKLTFRSFLREFSSFLWFFLSVGFVVSCCMMLFVSILADTMDLAITPDNVGTAAKVTFWNVVLITFLFKLADYIRRWAPPCENDTNSYINFVAKRSGLADVSVIDTTNKEQMVKIVAAMARMENTADPDIEPILQGWELFTKDRLI